jgi:hypothetical protein
MLWVGIQYHSAVPLSPERRDFHNRIQAIAQFADKRRGLLLPERQDFVCCQGQKGRGAASPYKNFVLLKRSILQISIIPHSVKNAFIDKNNNLHEIPRLSVEKAIPPHTH